MKKVEWGDIGMVARYEKKEAHIEFRFWLVDKKVMSRGYTISELLDGGWYDIGEHVAMQYTGLKDKNGVKIFEGDIVKFHDQASIFPEIDPEIGVVVWKESFPGFFITNIAYFPGETPFPNDELEVIRNVYEHKELIREQ